MSDVLDLVYKPRLPACPHEGRPDGAPNMPCEDCSRAERRSIDEFGLFAPIRSAADIARARRLRDQAAKARRHEEAVAEKVELKRRLRIAVAAKSDHA